MKREEYGLDHLVSRDVEPTDAERPVPNPQKKALKKELEQKLRQLKTKKEHYTTKAADNDEKLRRTIFRFLFSGTCTDRIQEGIHIDKAEMSDYKVN